MREVDAGLKAVRRVRGVREQDSRQGLQQANAEVRVAEGALARLAESLNDDRSPGAVAPAGDFVAVRSALTALSGRISTARDGLDLSRSVADAALVHWQADHARVRAVEHLLQRRAEERQREAERREARELDDLAAQRWLRDRGDLT
jgi:flagellar export protein FliJ